jgi:hypothetical protein
VCQNENLFLDRADHYQYQTDRSELRENAKDNSETSGEFSRAETNREAFAHSDILAPSSGSWKCFDPLVMNTIPAMMRKRRSATSLRGTSWGKIMR